MFNNFITAGCSFTAGNSVIEEVTRSPSVWPDFLVSWIDAKVFYNIGITGGGNCAMCDSLIYLLETKKYINPGNTLIGINITGLDRIDTMCAVDHPNDTNRFSWKHDFGFSWINEGGFTCQIPPFNGDLQKHIGLEQIHLLNALAVTKCLTYLESHKFSYFFMVMDDQVIQDSPPWFLDFLNCRKKKWITFGNHNTMHSFAKENCLLEEDGFHPSNAGHKLIADAAIEQLVDNNLLTTVKGETMPAKILICGLPGSGKTTLAKPFADLIGGVHINADEVRTKYDDWDFSLRGRIRQAQRMQHLADGVVMAGKVAVCDFVCPTEAVRGEFNPDFTVWMDTIKESKYEDTNKIFEKPSSVDYHVSKWFDDTHEALMLAVKRYQKWKETNV